MFLLLWDMVAYSLQAFGLTNACLYIAVMVDEQIAACMRRRQADHQ